MAYVFKWKETLDSLHEYRLPAGVLRKSQKALGQGGFGKVFVATFTQDWRGEKAGSEVALKEIVWDSQAVSNRIAKALIREMRLWRKLLHHNVVRFIGFHFDEKAEEAWLVSPYIRGGHLREYMNKHGPLSSETKIRIALGVVNGVVYLHTLEPPVCHADLKPENILMGDDATPMLCDFGLAKVSEVGSTGMTTAAPEMTIRYSSPELLRTETPRHTIYSDIWALGCVILELTAGIIPHETLNNLNAITRRLCDNCPPADTGQLAASLPNLLLELLDRCWEPDWARRHTAVECQKIIEVINNRSGDGLRRGDNELAYRKENTSLDITATTLPVLPEIFLGRDAYVKNVIDRITEPSENKSCFAILGSGGMGKTSVAVAVCHDSRVRAHFVGGVHWISCVEVTSATLLIDALFDVFDIPVPSYSQLKELISILKTSSQPRLLVLDNVETPLDSHKSSAFVEDVLLSVASVPRLTLLLTRRGSQYVGLDRMPWARPKLEPLEPLEPAAAREVYLENQWDAKGGTDALDDLLDAVDRVPLAVHLLARVAYIQKLAPGALLSQWKREKTSVAELGPDSRSSLNISIRLSLDSDHVRSRPEALKLLYILSMLPGGLSRDGKIFTSLTSSFKEYMADVTVLLRTGLAYMSKGPLQVLSPIRQYMLQYHDSLSTRKEVFAAYYNHVETRARTGSLQTGSDFQATIDWFKPEVMNLHQVLSDALIEEKSETAIQTAVHFSQFLDYYRPSADLAALCKDTAKAVASPLLPVALKQYGDNLLTVDEFDAARLALREAEEQYREVQNELDVTRCLRLIAFSYRMQDKLADAREPLHQALAGFQRIGDQTGIAECRRDLADIHLELGELAQARSMLADAVAAFKATGNDSGMAGCHQTTGDILCKERRFRDAESSFRRAHDLYKETSDELGQAASRRRWAEALLRLGELGEAAQGFEQSLELFSNLPDQSGIASSNQGLGDVRNAQRRHNEALNYLQAAKTAFERMDSAEDAVAECQRSLGNAYLGTGEYDAAETSLKAAMEVFQAREDGARLRDCQRIRGLLLVARAQYFEARSLLVDALEDARKTSDPLSQGFCHQSLGELNFKQGHSKQAIKHFKQALIQFQVLDDAVGKSDCAARLGELLRSRSRLYEASMALQEAQKDVERANDSRRTADIQALINSLPRNGGLRMGVSKWRYQIGQFMHAVLHS